MASRVAFALVVFSQTTLQVGGGPNIEFAVLIASQNVNVPHSRTAFGAGPPTSFKLRTLRHGLPSGAFGVGCLPSGAFGVGCLPSGAFGVGWRRGWDLLRPSDFG